MADSMKDQVTGSSAASGPDHERVSQIVAALRQANAEQQAPAGLEAAGEAEVEVTEVEAEVAAVEPEGAEPEPPAPVAAQPPRRESTGVRPVAAPPEQGAQEQSDRPTRWDPGARYRASQLAGRPMPPVPPPPAPMSLTDDPQATLSGRLFRGPARRTAVFEREIWHPVPARSPRTSHDIGEALLVAVERYRRGSISTTGLVRAIGRAHAA